MSNQLKEIMGRNLLMWSDLTQGPLLQGQTRVANLKSAYNSLTIGPRGWKLDQLDSPTLQDILVGR